MDQGDVIYPMVITVEGLNAYVLQFLQGVVVVINRSLKKKVSAIKILSVNIAVDHVHAGGPLFYHPTFLVSANNPAPLLIQVNPRVTLLLLRKSTGIST